MPNRSLRATQISRNSTRHWRSCAIRNGRDYAITSRNGVEEATYVEIGGIQQWIPQTQPLGRHHDYSGVDFDGSRHHFKVNYAAGHSTQTMQRTMPVSFTPSDIKELIAGAPSRFDLWVKLLRSRPLECAAEIGVWKGDFAKVILSNFGNLTKYYMIDPWAHLPDWNKPFNVDDQTFEDVYAEALLNTDFAANRRVVLRGRTSAVIDEIPDQSLDFAYIDGDHTLRGISMDLIQVLPKIKDGGLIGGDDFVNKPWQHGTAYEPTLVCPFAVYFAEAMRLPFVALPHKQFLIQKAADGVFSFIDLVGTYSDLSLKGLSQSSMGKRV